MPGLLRSTLLRPWLQQHVTWPSGGQRSYGRSRARPMAARQTPQVSLKSPYSVGSPSRENRRQVWPPPPAPHVVQIKSQSGGLEQKPAEGWAEPLQRVNPTTSL